MSGKLVAAGTENTKDGPGDVAVYVWDRRAPSAPIRTYPESHNDTITHLLFSPFHPTHLLSSSTDALLTLYDTAHADEADAVLQVFNHGGAVHLASFLAADEIMALSSDEIMAVYEISRAEDVEDEEVHSLSTVNGDVRGELGAGYVVQVVKVGEETWVASGELERQGLELTPLVRVEDGRTKWRFDHGRAVAFGGAHGEEVVRDVLLEAESQKVVSCGEDGMVRVWAVPETVKVEAEGKEEMEVDDGDGADLEERRRKERKRRKKEKRERQKERLKH